MIISHRYRFIYLRTEKTGSSAVIQALAPHLGPEDVITAPFEGEWLRFLPVDPGGLKRYLPDLFGLHMHATAAQVRRVLGRRIFDSYFKFSVERNPWDRQVSLYFHRRWKRADRQPHFDRDMRSPLYRLTHHVRLRNWQVYAIGNRIVADRVIRYENLGEELPALLRELGMDAPAALPRANTGYGVRRPHYSLFYSDATRDLVGRWYRREIEAFGFRFEDRRQGAEPLAGLGTAAAPTARHDTNRQTSVPRRPANGHSR